MKIPIILAHGALGGFDEVIFIGRNSVRCDDGLELDKK